MKPAVLGGGGASAGRRRALVRLGGVAWMACASKAFAFQDPRDTPAATQPGVGGAMLSGIAQAGHRLVAVGSRGVIALSADAGLHWTQAPSPVSSDLVAVQFVDADHGWATGHDGVILRSVDGGRNWVKLTDGHQSIARMKAFYAPRLAQRDPDAVAAVKLLEANGQADGDLPWLSLSFQSRSNGFVVGPFGMIAATDDGGTTLTPWLDRIDNPAGLHLNAIQQIGGDLFIAAEKGVVFKLDRVQARFVRLQTGYEGTFFGITGDAERLLAFGLRGACYQSIDGGASWKRIETGLSSGIAAGTVLTDGRAVLVGQGGQVVVADGPRFLPLPLALSRIMAFTDVLALPADRLVLVGQLGAVVVAAPIPRTS